MKIKIICGFQVKNRDYLNLEANWLKRLPNNLKPEIIEIKNRYSDEKSSKSEFIKILKDKCGSNAFKILLAEDGQNITSKTLANKLESLQVDFVGNSTKEINFIIGGPYGVSKALYKEFDFLLSLSALTITSELARVLLIEQLYRAYTINQGLPYHKE